MEAQPQDAGHGRHAARGARAVQEHPDRRPRHGGARGRRPAGLVVQRAELLHHARGGRRRLHVVQRPCRQPDHRQHLPGHRPARRLGRGEPRASAGQDRRSDQRTRRRRRRPDGDRELRGARRPGRHRGEHARRRTQRGRPGCPLGVRALLDGAPGRQPPGRDHQRADLPHDGRDTPRRLPCARDSERCRSGVRRRARADRAGLHPGRRRRAVLRRGEPPEVQGLGRSAPG